MSECTAGELISYQLVCFRVSICFGGKVHKLLFKRVLPLCHAPRCDDLRSLTKAPCRVPRTAVARLTAAVVAVRNGVTMRCAAIQFHVPKSTLCDAVAISRARDAGILKPKTLGRPLALSPAEEDIVVRLLCKFSDRGSPLLRRHFGRSMRYAH